MKRDTFNSLYYARINRFMNLFIPDSLAWFLMSIFALAAILARPIALTLSLSTFLCCKSFLTDSGCLCRRLQRCVARSSLLFILRYFAWLSRFCFFLCSNLSAIDKASLGRPMQWWVMSKDERCNEAKGDVKVFAYGHNSTKTVLCGILSTYNNRTKEYITVVITIQVLVVGVPTRSYRTLS